MSILAQNEKTKKEALFIKGAPDYLLKKASHAVTKSGKVVPLSDNDKKSYDSAIKELATAHPKLL